MHETSNILISTNNSPNKSPNLQLSKIKNGNELDYHNNDHENTNRKREKKI